ncbi:alpha/beta fold hydrolase [Actinosynnema sp. NPDC050436]|uniref:alpha/beta fold hydrolase n=1 Tax=Actinosynnema sp. NPDC050436 TaxID=3155659 RepID=UPI0033C19082
MTTVVLVHGAWHGAWAWSRVEPLLREEGLSTTAVELPFTTFADDVGAVRDAVVAAGGPVLLVGHSYGGSPVSAASATPGVAGVVFVTAKVVRAGGPQDLGESELPAGHTSVLTPELTAAIELGDDGRTRVAAADALDLFYHDCPTGPAHAAARRLRPVAVACATGSPTSTGWQHLPTTYVLCTQDRAIPLAVQEAYASRLTGDRVRLHAGHSPFYSHPADLAHTLVRAAHNACR